MGGFQGLLLAPRKLKNSHGDFHMLVLCRPTFLWTRTK
jgi:hypothetical protein